ncbi:MAG: Dehydrogenase [Algoriphagus marincola HL-49]|uniref:Dehydrogenase n=1 Tax=Algoriphagus marincola HL-49 TaxID=1305737 RepID=A0A0P8AI67_9BACT|nr:MAG: Dehydrogenase [Algoriphagus marincola HL-49]
MKMLKDQVAIITGAASGIGRAAALLYAQEGAKVVVSDVDEKQGNEVTDEIKKAGGEAMFFKADISSAEDNQKLVDAAIQEYGKLDIAVNNAGIGGPLAPTAEYPLDGWQNVINTNLSGVFYGMHYQLQAMEKVGKGVIVNIASILGDVGTPMSPAYVAAKHGLVGLTKASALAYAAKNIRINSVGPGYILTPLLTNNLDEDTLKMIEGLHPIGRLGTSEEVAELILWLGSSKSSFVTGSYYPVDGGYLAQ